jgi:hypothetical protein
MYQSKLPERLLSLSVSYTFSIKIYVEVCHKCLWFVTNPVQVSSTQETYLREQNFIQTNPRGTLTRILMSRPLLPQPARNFSGLPQASLPMLHLHSGYGESLQPILVAGGSHGSPGTSGHPEKGQCSQAAAASASELRDRLRQRLQRSGGQQ